MMQVAVNYIYSNILPIYIAASCVLEGINGSLYDNHSLRFASQRRHSRGTVGTATGFPGPESGKPVNFSRNVFEHQKQLILNQLL